MPPLIVVLVYWCLASAPIDQFNPHQLHASQKFVADNPATCFVSQGEVLEDRTITAETCRRRSFLDYMPGWLQQHPGARYLGAECIEEKREKLDLRALKSQVSP